MRKKKIKPFFFMGLFCFVTASCVTSQKNGNTADTQVMTMENVNTVDTGEVDIDQARDMTRKNNAFALNLFRQVSGFDSKIVSTLSVTYLLSMLTNGANDVTRQEILNVLGWGSVSVDDINRYCKTLLRNTEGKEGAAVNIANYIAVNKNLALKKNYVKSMKSVFRAAVENLDFSSSETPLHINAWCSKQTNGMIKEMVKQVDSQALSYLLNAVFFKGTWEKKFDSELTKTESFHGYTRDLKRVQMMGQEGKFSYTTNDMYSAVSLPYEHGEYSMVVVLPNEDKSISDVLKTMTAESLTNVRSGMEPCMVDLKLPRFATELTLPLNEIISSLGAPTMFDSQNADFSLMADGHMFVSQMLQKAKIEVTESGTKAAAVTMGTIMMTSVNMQPVRHVSFHANRPFMYFITESDTGAILFMGQYTGE